MIDIIILIFLCQRIKYIVEAKGYRSGKWQLFTILVWLGAELIGCTISILMGKSLIVIYLSGMLFAIGGFLMFQERVKKLPVKNNTSDG